MHDYLHFDAPFRLVIKDLDLIIFTSHKALKNKKVGEKFYSSPPTELKNKLYYLN